MQLMAVSRFACFKKRGMEVKHLAAAVTIFAVSGFASSAWAFSCPAHFEAAQASIDSASSAMGAVEASGPVGGDGPVARLAVAHLEAAAGSANQKTEDRGSHETMKERHRVAAGAVAVRLMQVLAQRANLVATDLGVQTTTTHAASSSARLIHAIQFSPVSIRLSHQTVKPRS